jgi:hypothetical protein
MDASRFEASVQYRRAFAMAPEVTDLERAARTKMAAKMARASHVIKHGPLKSGALMSIRFADRSLPDDSMRPRVILLSDH